METTIGTPTPYGPSVTSNGVNFAIVSKSATAVTLCLIDPASRQTIEEIPLDKVKNRTGNVWHIQISDLKLPVLYGWRVDGPKTQDKRYRFDPKRILIDPYARFIHSHPVWGDREDPSPSIGAVLPPDQFDWEGDVPIKIPYKDLIIYEMHVRAFTQDKSSKVQHPGTYKGIIEKIPYFLDLGVNAVELMPIHEFEERENFFEDPETKQPLLNTWGYNPISYYAPMKRFASSQEIGAAVTEFKEMVKELHKHGIAVILDVVYNHTGENGYQAPPVTFKGIDHPTYYMLDSHNNPQDFTGCGNTFNCNNPITKDFILSSLRYWVTEMHVDGFRFDLATVLNRGRFGKPLGISPLVDAIAQDPILADTIMIAEPWDPGGLYQVGAFYPQDDRFSEWNGKYRDTVRQFLNGIGSSKGEFATRITGSQDLYGYNRRPTTSVNFITAHDGFSLADLVSYNQKNNYRNGEENRDGLNENDSWNCGAEGVTEDQEILAKRHRQMRNFIVALFVSHGIPMLLMGDEYAHTKHGNNNSYGHDDELNWFLWNDLEKNQDFYRFVKKMIEFRKKNANLLQRDTFVSEIDILWHGVTPMYQDWDNGDGVIAYSLIDKKEDGELYIAFNIRRDEGVEITVPDLEEGHQWTLIVDTSKPSPEDIVDEENAKPLEGNKYQLESLSSLILKARKSTT